jgi:hypothetical protein
VGIALGPDNPIGLPASDARVVDTGPSAAVVGLAVFLGWRYRAYVTAGAVIVAMIVEVVLEAIRQRRSRARGGSTSGAPPIQS